MFQQAGAPFLFLHEIQSGLNIIFPNYWTGRGLPMPHAPQSPELSPMDFSVGIHKKISFTLRKYDRN